MKETPAKGLKNMNPPVSIFEASKEAIDRPSKNINKEELKKSLNPNKDKDFLFPIKTLFS
jgi:hypothetical protein